jgi:hypothetical protein
VDSQTGILPYTCLACLHLWKYEGESELFVDLPIDLVTLDLMILLFFLNNFIKASFAYGEIHLFKQYSSCERGETPLAH